MIYVCLDTNILLNTLKSQYHSDSFVRFLEDINKLENVEVVIQEQVKREWERNKLTVYEDILKTMDNVVKEIDLVKYFSDSATYNELNKILQPETKNLKEIMKKNLEDLLARIEKLIQDSKYLPCNDQLLVDISKQAMKKEGHLFGSEKNNFGDAVIIKHLVHEFNSNQNIDEIYFITENYREFSVSKSQKKDLHTDIISEIEPTRLQNFKYYINVEKFVYEFSVDHQIKKYSYEEELKAKERIEWRQKIIEWDIHVPNDRIDCPNCKKILDDRKDGRWGHGMYGGGLSWHRICPRCGLEWDTGEYFEY